MARYEDFIPENVALSNTTRIGVYNKQNGNRVGTIPLGSLTPPDVGKKQYSFGALSDVHITYDTATEDFQRALTFLNEDADVAFTCICGDLTENGSAEQLEQYKVIVDAYSADTPVYAISGNHEATLGRVTMNGLTPYTGQPLYYSFTHVNDVFIMCGEHAWNADALFMDGELQWLYETLETNRNKRCFVFFHVFPWGDSGNAGGIYAPDITSSGNLFTGTHGAVFQSLMQHYKNVVLFHGHSHLKFYLQEIDDKANYSKALGFHSVHIPSLAVPRESNGSGGLVYVYADSEGYVVDVYENGIHLRGRDFVKGEFLPIASYWLDTTLQTIPSGTYTDSTGTITK
jgi:predicted phosphodiesterase